MPIQPRLDAATAVANMADTKPPLTPQEAKVEAGRAAREP